MSVTLQDIQLTAENPNLTYRCGAGHTFIVRWEMGKKHPSVHPCLHEVCSSLLMVSKQGTAAKPNARTWTPSEKERKELDSMAQIHVAEGGCLLRMKS